MALHAQPTLSYHDKVVEELSAAGLIYPNKDFKPGTVFHLFGRMKPKATEVACATDPFAYLSHLSAMEHHGLTDRFPKTLYLTTPTDKEWRSEANARMDKDLKKQTAAYRAAGLPPLTRLTALQIENKRIELIRRTHRGAFKSIKSAAIRVATVGRTFLDMLRDPQHCGGIQHVVDTYQAYAEQNLTLIIDEIDRHGNAIERVRAGYLLDEVCHLTDPQINSWTVHAQRGGSRMLDPAADYSSHFSEKWMLSINVPSLMP